ncbi:MAG: DoxX family protein [Crocinitomicaceae bacterium]|nr:DoxX family protein [Crocinitomicaceae bacterium]
MKKIRIAHWIFTALLSAMILMGAGMYLFQTEMVEGMFGALGFPTWLIYPMATAKILGVITLLTKFNKRIVEWAYAGFTFNLLLAIGAHAGAGEPIMGVLPPLAFMILSYATYVYGWKSDSK